MDAGRGPALAALRLVLKQGSVPLFFPPLQQGVQIGGRVGCSLQSFLCDQVGLSTEYVETRIQTFFLDGKAVDDPSSAIVRDGSRIALSTAMPGLLGATLRKGSFYAKMRDQISHTEMEGETSSKDGKVLVKLFNLLIQEIGPTFLKRGVYMQGEDLRHLITEKSGPLLEGCAEATLNGEKIDPLKLVEMKWPEGQVFLKIEAAC